MGGVAERGHSSLRIAVGLAMTGCAFMVAGRRSPHEPLPPFTPVPRFVEEQGDEGSLPAPVVPSTPTGTVTTPPDFPSDEGRDGGSTATAAFSPDSPEEPESPREPDGPEETAPVIPAGAGPGCSRRSDHALAFDAIMSRVSSLIDAASRSVILEFPTGTPLVTPNASSPSVPSGLVDTSVETDSGAEDRPDSIVAIDLPVSTSGTDAPKVIVSFDTAESDVSIERQESMVVDDPPHPTGSDGPPHPTGSDNPPWSAVSIDQPESTVSVDQPQPIDTQESEVSTDGTLAQATEAGVTEAGVTEAGVTEAGVRESGGTEAGVTEAGVRESGGTEEVASKAAMLLAQNLARPNAGDGAPRPWKPTFTLSSEAAIEALTRTGFGDDIVGPVAEGLALGRDLESLLLEAFAGLTPPPPPPRRAGSLLVVVGAGHRAQRLAASVAEEIGVDQRDVAFSSRHAKSSAAKAAVRSAATERVVGTAVEAAERAPSWRRSQPAVVAVDAPVESAERAWANHLIASLRPTAVWGVVDSTCKAEDVASWARGSEASTPSRSRTSPPPRAPERLYGRASPSPGWTVGPPRRRAGRKRRSPPFTQSILPISRNQAVVVRRPSSRLMGS